MQERQRNRVTVTKGMANQAKRVKHVCPGCGLKIPVYPGNYPQRCPSCSTPLKSKKQEESTTPHLEKLVGDLIAEVMSGQNSVSGAARRLANDPTLDTTGYMQALLRYINANDLLDFFIAYDIIGPEDRPTSVKLNFSDDLDETKVRAIATELEELAQSVSYHRVPDEGKTGWQLVLMSPRSGSEPKLQGDPSVSVGGMLGQIDVQG